MKGRGLVMFDLSGGDFAFAYVDEELWQQICALNIDDVHKRAEVIGWLTCADPEVHRPEGAPDRRGKILSTFYCQNHVIEAVKLEGVVGVLTLP